MLQKLVEMYGVFDDSTTDWINENLGGLSQEQEHNFIQRLQEVFSKRKGKPEIYTLKKVLEEIIGKKRTYYWAVCDTCGAYYDYKFMTCPSCFLAARKSTGYKVKMSDNPPPFKTIRWNQTSLNLEDKTNTCFECADKENSYCPHFGDFEWSCRKEDFDYCKCKACCIRHKKANAEMMKK